MKRLLIFCCIMLLVTDVQSCNITIDSILNEETSSIITGPNNWSWTITVDSINGINSDNCLINETIHCKTLDFVLKSIADFSTQPISRPPCLKLVLSKNSKGHVIPYNAPPLTEVSLYFVSEEDSLITCDNNLENTTTVWSIKNAAFVVFKSLHFSSCNQRLEITNITNVYFENVKIRYICS